VSVLNKTKAFPVGYSEVFFENRKYGIPRTDFNNGRAGVLGFMQRNWVATILSVT